MDPLRCLFFALLIAAASSVLAYALVTFLPR
jgi:hypothetical protein